MINLLILTLIVLATSVVNAFIDNYLIKKKWGKVKNLNHTSRTIIRLIVFGTSIGFIYGFEIHIQEYMWQMLLELFKPFLLLLYSFLLFNVTFDLLLNYLRKLPWYYDGKDAITDQISNLVNSDADEFIAYIELGVKIFITLGLAVWILLI